MQHLQKNAGGGCTSFFFESFARHVPRDSSPFASCSCALFCTLQKPTLLFSSNSALFRKNTRGWGIPLLSVSSTSVRPDLSGASNSSFSIKSQLFAMNLSPCALPFPCGCILFMPRSAAGFSSRPPAASKHRHVHGRQQRKSTGNATERLLVPSRIRLQSRNHRPQLSLACALQRFSRHGDVAAHAHPSGLAGSASPVPLQPRQFVGSLCRAHPASWFSAGFSGSHPRAANRVRKLLPSA